jgi:hypothetical protein
MNGTVKKLDDEKNKIIERRTEIEKETESFKENMINIVNSTK